MTTPLETLFEAAKTLYEEFYTDHLGAGVGYRFSATAPKQLQAVTRRAGSADALTAFARFAPLGLTEETYTRDGERVTEVRVRQLEPGKAWVETRFTAMYDLFGELAVLTKHYVRHSG